MITVTHEDHIDKSLCESIKYTFRHIYNHTLHTCKIAMFLFKYFKCPDIKYIKGYSNNEDDSVGVRHLWMEYKGVELDISREVTYRVAGDTGTHNSLKAPKLLYEPEASKVHEFYDILMKNPKKAYDKLLKEVRNKYQLLDAVDILNKVVHKTKFRVEIPMIFEKWFYDEMYSNKDKFINS